MKAKFIAWFLVVYVIMFVVDLVLILNKISIDNNNIWNWGWIIASLQMIYLVLSFRTVRADEKAVILLFERPLYEVNSGLVFIPWLICNLRIETSLVIQIQIPGEPEEVDKSGDDEKGVASGKFLPIRATTGSYESVKKSDEFKDDPALIKDDPLNERMTLEPSAQIVLKIKDISKFIRNIGSVAMAKKLLRDTSEGVIQSEFAKRTPALIIAHRTEINKKIREQIRLLIKDDPNTAGHDEGWGAEIEAAQLLEIDISKKVNEALSQVAEAKALQAKVVTNAISAKLAKIEQGLGDKDYAIRQGEGVAKARELLLLAEAVGLDKLAELAKTPSGQLTMIVQQAKEMYEKAKYSILPGNGEGLYGAVAGIQEVLKRIQGEGEEKKNTEKPASTGSSKDKKVDGEKKEEVKADTKAEVKKEEAKVDTKAEVKKENKGEK